MTMLAVLVFGMALASAVGVIAMTIAPNMSRIADALGRRNRHFAPLETLAMAERRIAIRRWAAPQPVRVRARAAA